jgi:hypothetical protein
MAAGPFLLAFCREVCPADTRYVSTEKSVHPDIQRQQRSEPGHSQRAQNNFVLGSAHISAGLQ